MKKELTLFVNEELGLQARTIVNEDGSISINAEDTAIGYGWCRTETKGGREYQSIMWARMNKFCAELGFAHECAKDDYIPETLFYMLGFKAGNDRALVYQKWIAMKVLPSIRKTGSYSTVTEDDPLKQMDIESRKLRAEAMRLNAKTKIAKTILDAYKDAGIDANYQVLALNEIYSEVGIHLPLGGLKVDEPSFDKETIAKQLSVLSKNGKPHPQAIGAIIEKVGVSESEVVKVPFMKNGHSGSCDQYKEPVVQRISHWLKENGYPTVIKKSDGSNINVTYSV